MQIPPTNQTDSVDAVVPEGPGFGQQREVTRTDHVTVGTSPEATLARLVDLPGTLGPDRGLAIDGWPEGGLSDLATFRVGRPGDGDVAYEIRPRHEATGLTLRATGAQWTADHQVDVHPLPDGSSEVTWQVKLSSHVPVTDAFVAQASALSTATLQALHD